MPHLRAIAPPGLEPVVARELADLGIQPELQPGHVLARIDGPEQAARLAHRLHTPSRLLLEVVRGPVATLDQLARLARSADWTPFLQRRTPLRVSVTARGSRIRRKDTAVKKVEHAIADALRKPGPFKRGGGAPIEQHVRVRLDGGQGVLSIDVGGDLLHKRGWRRQVGKAPLRETLAASLLILAGWSGDEPLLDPFCGAGTFCIEAGRMATERGPFVGRRLACAAWPAVGALPRARTQPLEVTLFASDQSPRAVEQTVANARTADIDVVASTADVRDLQAPAPAGLLIANPPYGARLGTSEASVAGVYKALGHALRGPLAGWRALFLAPSERLAAAVDRRAFQLTRFSNGSRTVGAYGLDPADLTDTDV